MKKSNVNNQGITLIALVITIIVLLILAGITIATVTGDNGILNKANLAREETKKKEYEEVLKIIGNGLRPDKVINYETSEEYMKKYSEKIEEDETFNKSIIKLDEKKDPIIIVVETQEGYIYWVTEEKVEYIGKKGENVPPDLVIPEDLEKGNVKFTYIPSSWTNQDVEVKISTELKGYILQYSTDSVNWQDYTSAITRKENGSIYARLTNKLGEAGGYATCNISHIDKELPEKAMMIPNQNQVNIGENVTITVTQSDLLSGVKIEECRYAFTISNVEMGVDDIEKYDGTFSKTIEEKLTLNCPQAGTYYFHILTVDKAGNRKESISEGIKATYTYTIITGGILQKSNYFYCGSSQNGYVQQMNGLTRVKVWNESDSYSAATWEIPVMGENATIICDMESGGGTNKNVRTTWLFGAPIQPQANSKSTGPYTNFYGSTIIATGAEALKTPRQVYQIPLSGINNVLHVGFFLNSANTTIQRRTNL